MKRIFTVILLVLLPVSAAAQERLTLDDCIAAALERNSNLNTAVSQLGMARADRLGAYSTILPNLSFNFGPSRFYRSASQYESFVPSGTDEFGNIVYDKRSVKNPAVTYIDYSASVSYNQNIWDNGRWWNQIHRGESQVRSNEYSVQNTVINTVLTVTENFYQLQKAIEQKSVLEQAVNAAEEQLGNSESMFEIGTVAQVDVFRSRVNLGNQRSNLLNHDLVIENAKHQLNISMGRDAGTPVELTDPAASQIEYDLSLDNLISQGLRSHPQLRQYEQDIMSSEMSVKIAKSARWPRLTGYMRYSRSNSEFNQLYTELDLNYNVNMGLSLNFTIFDGLQTKSSIQRSQNQLRMSEENFENVKRQVQASIRYNYLHLEQYQAKLQIAEETLAAAEEEARLERERYRVGSGRLIDSILADTELTRARYNLVSMQYDSKIAEARLHAAAGKLNEKYADTVFDRN